MEPKKNIKKYHFEGFDYEKELYKFLNEFSRLNKNTRGQVNWIVTSPSVAKLINLK